MHPVLQLSLSHGPLCLHCLLCRSWGVLQFIVIPLIIILAVGGGFLNRLRGGWKPWPREQWGSVCSVLSLHHLVSPPTPTLTKAHTHTHTRTRTPHRMSSSTMAMLAPCLLCPQGLWQALPCCASAEALPLACCLPSSHSSPTLLVGACSVVDVPRGSVASLTPPTCDQAGASTFPWAETSSNGQHVWGSLTGSLGASKSQATTFPGSLHVLHPAALCCSVMTRVAHTHTTQEVDA